MDLIDFIRRNIPSVWALELLLVLRRQPVRAWSASELVGELRASEGVVTPVLAGFQRRGLVSRESEGAYRFRAASACIDQLCDALASAYRQRPRVVISAITASDDQVSALAEAFRFKDKPR